MYELIKPKCDVFPSSSAIRARKGERGVALVIALVMLALLTILGALAISTSTTELRISGNYRAMQESFNLADSAVEYASTAAPIYIALSGVNNTWPVGAGTAAGEGYPGYNNVDLGFDFDARVRVEVLLRDQPAPIGTGYDHALSTYGHATSMFDYMAIKTIGNGPNNTETFVESVIMRAK